MVAVRRFDHVEGERSGEAGQEASQAPADRGPAGGDLSTPKKVRFLDHPLA